MRKLLFCVLLFGLGMGGAVIVTKPAGAQTQAVDGTLTGQVGDPGAGANDFVISLSPTSVPAAGTYEFDITDYAGIHNFDLLAPGGASVDKTSITGTTTATWTVALSPGVYTFHCDAHALTMNGTLTVPGSTTTTGTTTTAPTTTAPTTTSGGGSPLKIRIVSAHATAHSVTIKVSSSKKGRATARLFKGTKRLAKASHAVPGKITLRPSRPLKPGSYVVKVRVTAGGKTASARKTVRVR
jgi:plastocyanin